VYLNELSIIKLGGLKEMADKEGKLMTVKEVAEYLRLEGGTEGKRYNFSFS